MRAYRPQVQVRTRYARYTTKYKGRAVLTPLLKTLTPILDSGACDASCRNPQPRPRPDVEHARRCADLDRCVAVELHRQRYVALRVVVDRLGKDGPRVYFEELSGRRRRFDDGAVLLVHGGVGDHASVEPIVEDLECLAARGGTAAARCIFGVCAKIAR